VELSFLPAITGDLKNNILKPEAFKRTSLIGKPAMQGLKTLERDVFQKESQTVQFSGKNVKPQPPEEDIPVVEYRNMFDTLLKASPNPLLEKLLVRDLKISDPEKAHKRITSLSRYLKEDMVGFITPDGRHWFEGALKYFIRGAVSKDLTDKQMEKHGPAIAEHFWGLLAKADSYWSSGEFLDYMKNHMNPEEPGVKETIQGVSRLYQKKLTNKTVSFGYSSDLRYIQKLLDDGGAYTGKPLKLTNVSNHPAYPTLEHIQPHSTGGDEVNDDCNYLLVRQNDNGDRSNIPLIAYLKGWDAQEFLNHRKYWYAEISQIMSGEKFNFYTNEITQKDIKKAEKMLEYVHRSINNRKNLYKKNYEFIQLVLEVSKQPPSSVNSLEKLGIFWQPAY
jgi:hypothetical protein